MPTKFLESLGSKLAEKWLTAILTPAFIFWGGGLGWGVDFGEKEGIKYQAESL
jgi:hypothetical protein